MSEETKKTEEQVDAPKVEKTEAKAETTSAKAEKAIEKIEETVEEVETPVAVEEVKEVVKKVSPEEFLENFNWHKYEEGIEAVDEENIKAFEAALEGTLGLVNEREVIDRNQYAT